MDELNYFKKFTEHLAFESGKIINDYFRRDIRIETKSDQSPVTIADKKAEEIIRELINKEFPEHGIVGEEFGSSNGNAEYKWIIDPIDGTKSFISGIATFGTLISLTVKGVPVLGAFHQPVIKELVIGDNSLTTCNNVVVKCRETDKIQDAVLLTTDFMSIKKYRNFEKFMELAGEVRFTRTWGDCFGYYLLATGFADIMLDPIMSVWDTMALIPIINGANGVIADWNGGDPVAGDSIIATNKRLFQYIVNKIN